MNLRLPSHIPAQVGDTVPADYFRPPDGPRGPVNELVAFSPYQFNWSVDEADKLHFERYVKGGDWCCTKREPGKCV